MDSVLKNFNIIRLIYATLMLILIAGSCGNNHFPNAYAAENPSKIEFKFNGKTFTKDYPKDYNQSVQTINDMKDVIVDFALALDSIDSVNVKTVNAVNNSINDINKYTDSIKVLANSIDSLNKNIKRISDSTKHVIDSLCGITKKSIDQIPTKPFINGAFTIGYDRSIKVSDDIIENSIKLAPYLFVKRLMVGVDLSGCVRSSPGNSDVYFPRIGGSVGFTFK